MLTFCTIISFQNTTSWSLLSSLLLSFCYLPEFLEKQKQREIYSSGSSCLIFNHCPRRISFSLRPGSKRQWQETEQEIEKQKERLFSSYHAKMFNLCSNWNDVKQRFTFPLQAGVESLLNEEFLPQKKSEMFVLQIWHIFSI